MFGQIVVGPPGSGKTTYCGAAARLLTERLGRPVAVVNLDPANQGVATLPYTAAVDIGELISLEETMAALQLGPNGALLYCMEYLANNWQWLVAALRKLPRETYLLLDCPGQVELYTHNSAVPQLLARLATELDVRLAAVHLADSHYCAEPSKFVAVLLASLSAMMQLGLPHVNVLSKADLVEASGRLPFNLDYFTEVLDLDLLAAHLEQDPWTRRYGRFNRALIGVVEDRSLVSFVLLVASSAESLLRLIRRVDQANGYVYGSAEERDVAALLSTAVAAEFQYEAIGAVQERHVAPAESLAEFVASAAAEDAGGTGAG